MDTSNEYDGGRNYELERAFEDLKNRSRNQYESSNDSEIESDDSYEFSDVSQTEAEDLYDYYDDSDDFYDDPNIRSGKRKPLMPGYEEGDFELPKVEEIFGGFKTDKVKKPKKVTNIQQPKAIKSTKKPSGFSFNRRKFLVGATVFLLVVAVGLGYSTISKANENAKKIALQKKQEAERQIAELKKQQQLLEQNRKKAELAAKKKQQLLNQAKKKLAAEKRKNLTKNNKKKITNHWKNNENNVKKRVNDILDKYRRH